MEKIVNIDWDKREEELSRLNPGQKVIINGSRIETYIGLELVQTCSCNTCPNAFELPVTVYEENNLIKRRVANEGWFDIINAVENGERANYYRKIIRGQNGN